MFSRVPPSLLSLVLLLELPFLADRPLIRDETTSIQLAGRHWGAFWEALQHIDAPLGLYYLLLRPIVAISDGAFAARLPSLVGAIVAVAVLVRAMELRFGRGAAAWTALLLLANPGIWLFADLARPYALALATTAVTLYVLLAAPHRTVLYGIFALLTVYLQLLFALFLVAQGVLLLKQRQRRLLAALVVAGLATVPLVVVASGQTVMTSWIPYTSPSSLREQAFDLFGQAPKLSVLATAVYVVVAVQALRSPDGRRLVLLAAVPTTAVVVAGFGLRLLAARYVAYLLLCLAAAGGVALVSVRRPRIPAAALALLAAACAVHLARIDYLQDDLPAATAYLTSHDEPGDALLFAPDWARPGIQYWLDHTAGNGPEDIAVRPGTDEASTGHLFLPERSTTELRQALSGRARVWVVGYPGQTWRPTANTSGDVAAELGRTWQLVDRKSFGQIELRLLTR